MRDPSLAIQKAVYQALRSHPGVTGMVAQRVYDQVPDGVAFPYCQIGDDVVQAEHLWAIVTITVYGVTQSVGMPEAKALAAEIKACLDAGLTLDDGFATILSRYEQTDFSEDAELGFQQCAVTFEFYVQDLSVPFL